MLIKGWLRNYEISPKMAEVYTNAILNVLNGTYTENDGQTTFEGRGISNVISELRGPRFRCRLPGLECDCIKLFEALGFKTVQARGQRFYRGGKIGYTKICTVVTL